MQSRHPEYRIGMTVSACLWLGLFPLLQGGTYARITHDKWIIMLVFTAFTFLCFCADPLMMHLAGRNKASLVADRRPLSAVRLFLPLVLAAALLIWTALSCFFSSYGPDTWWLGESARYEGLAAQVCYFLLFACFFFSRVSLKPVLYSAAAGVTVFFVVTMLQRGGGNPFGLYPAGRSYELNPEFQGTIGNVDMGTGYLLIPAGLFLHGIIGWIGKPRSSRCSSLFSVFRASLFFIVLSLSLVLTVFLIVTMDVQFGAVSLAALFLVTLFRFVPKKRRVPLLVFLIVLVLLVVWFWPGRSGGVWELHEILHGRGRLSFGSNRVAVWLYSLRLSGTAFLLGGGSGTFPSRFNRFLADNSLVIPNEQDGLPLPDYFDNPHSEYIAQLTDHGFPALLLFLALLLSAVFRRRDRLLPLLAPCSAAVLCYAVQAFFSFSVCLVAPMFWVVLGMSFRESE